MLSDDLIAYTQSDLFSELDPEVQAGYRDYATRVKASPKFVLVRDAAMLVHSISESQPSRFLSALGICRLPFPSIWVEFAFRDRADWLEDAIKRGMKVSMQDDASAPARLGFLLEETPDRILTIHPAWVHLRGRGYFSICNMALQIDLSNGGGRELTPSKLAEIQRQFDQNDKKGSTRWMKSDEEVAAGLELERRFDTIYPPCLENTWRLIAKGGPAAIDRARNAALFDLKSEWRFVLALLTVLNSRNVVSYGEEIDLTKLNKARAKKGAAPLSPYRDIRLNLSKVQRRRLGSSSGNFGNISAHMVMGHWKMRANGLYWWSPHVRGTGGEGVLQRTRVIR